MSKRDIKRAREDLSKLDRFRDQVARKKNHTLREAEDIISGLQRMGTHFEEARSYGLAYQAYGLMGQVASAQTRQYGKGTDEYGLFTALMDRAKSNQQRIRTRGVGGTRKERYALEKGEIGDDRNHKGLAGRVTSAFIGGIGIATGVFFLSPNLTGNIIGNLNQTSSNWIGVVLSVIGLIGAFAYFKIR